MNNWSKRVRLFDKKNKIMLPSAPLYKTDFYSCETGNYILLFSTGLNDENGKELYEDDIVKLRLCSQNLIRKVRHSYSGSWCIDIPAMGDSNINGASMLLSALKVTIIGNVHESPDLLK